MPKLNIKLIALGLVLIVVISLGSLWHKNVVVPQSESIKKFWPMESIDTVKYSRDPAGQYLTDASYDKVIDMQVKAIAGTGANYVAIGTPYDKRFVPFSVDCPRFQ